MAASSNIVNGDSASSIKVCEFNVNSIGKNPKRQEIFNFLRKKSGDIFVLIDTRFSQRIEKHIRAEWDGKVYFSSFTSQARGVAIFFRKNVCTEVLNVKKDSAGNMLSILIEFDGKTFLLSGIYGPNSDNPEFYRSKIFEVIDEWAPEFVIYTGDWNLVLDQAIDTKNYINENNIRGKAELKRQMDLYSLIDVWRELNPSTRQYTWFSKSSLPKKMSRLDYFLISNSLFPFISGATIEPGILSDHSITTLTVDFRHFTRGRGFWKFNNSLLKDPEYVTLIKKTIKNVVMQYAKTETDYDLTEDASPDTIQNIECTLNPQLLYDMIQLEMRGVTIKYSSRVKKERSSKTNLLLHKLESLETAADRQTPEEEEELIDIKNSLEEIMKIEAEGAAVRSRAKYKLEGEKATRMFCTLEKYNGTQKFIPQLIVDSDDGLGRTIEEQSAIEDEIRRYYSNLYSNHDSAI